MAFPILALIPLVEKIFDRVIPDPTKAAEAKLKLIELEKQGELAFLDADTKIALAQAGINLEEAKSTSLFKSGWRPFVGWVCASGFVWAFVLKPVLEFILAVSGIPLTNIPQLDTGALITMLGGLLGLGSFRTYERYKGVERT